MAKARLARKTPEPKAGKRKTAPAAPACDDDDARRIKDFHTGLLEHRDSAAEVKVYEEEKNRYKVILEGQKLGALIGRRGETLDALPSLVSRCYNKSENGVVRGVLDANDYRAKRAGFHTLKRLSKGEYEKLY